MDVLDRIKSWLGTDAQSDVRAALHEDHEQVQTMAAAMADAKGASERNEIFERLKPLITAHARAEEAVVYQAMIKASGEGKSLGNEGFVEHSLVDVLLERLSGGELAGTDAWQAHAIVLKEMLEHHVKEEEGEFFDMIGEAFDADRRKRLAAEFIAQRDALLGGDGEASDDQRARGR